MKERKNVALKSHTPDERRNRLNKYLSYLGWFHICGFEVHDPAGRTLELARELKDRLAAFLETGSGRVDVLGRAVDLDATKEQLYMICHVEEHLNHEEQLAIQKYRESAENSTCRLKALAMVRGHDGAEAIKAP